MAFSEALDLSRHLHFSLSRKSSDNSKAVGGASQLLSPEILRAPEVSPDHTAAFRLGMLEDITPASGESLSWAAREDGLDQHGLGQQTITSVACRSLFTSTLRKPCHGQGQGQNWALQFTQAFPSIIFSGRPSRLRDATSSPAHSSEAVCPSPSISGICWS